IKSRLNAVSITAALIDVNVARSKLVLLENFNENYSKFTTASTKVTTASTKLMMLKELMLLVNKLVLIKEFDLLKWDQQVVSELVEKL
ncbi:hypothetical protein Tco_1256928, partial [Tanacetum coccineum]